MPGTHSIGKGLRITGGRLWAAMAVVLVCAGVSAAQLSPGPLSRAHESLGGITQCTTCHTLRIGTAELKCLECHTEIAQRLTQKRGLHATLVKNPSDGKECASCHSDHNGAEFNLIRWDPPKTSFDHRQTGYTLEGKHAGVACEKCHTPANIRPADRPLIKIKDLSRTYLGTGQDCVTCHDDPHDGRLGSNCTQCHNFSDWEAASGFDHSKTRYPLTGLHAQVACEKCHTASGPQGTAKLTGLAFGTCKDCHQDPHRGSFTQTCESCHNTSGWGAIRMPASFDHSKTDFPLLGKHTAVGCAECHNGGDFKKTLAHAQCMDCHKPDPHQGQFREHAGGVECASCHTVDGFIPSTFGVKEHAESRYPLLGKHAEVACADCHTPAGAATKYKVAFGRCLDCHSDEHRGQFAATPYLNRCEDCHGFEGYRPAEFSLLDHQKTAFTLEGAHLAVPCADCHSTAMIAGGSTAKYHFAEQACTACHNDPHDGKFQATMDRVLADGTPAGCQACHNVQTWRDAGGFDHSTTEFPLTGAHRSVTCSACHLPLPAAEGSRKVSFRDAPTVCAECHQDEHGGQFVTASAQTDCTSCHVTARWTPSTFDHEKDSTVSLAGAHESVPCAECHELRRDVGGKSILFYKPTPTACADCHTDQRLASR
jgi:hypothetical protein